MLRPYRATPRVVTRTPTIVLHHPPTIVAVAVTLIVNFYRQFSANFSL